MKEEKANENVGATDGREPFFTVPSRVFALGLSPYELSVLLYLMMRADNKTHTCWPSVTSISNDCCISDTKVRRSIHSLAEKEIIEIKRQYKPTKKGFNRQCSNYYTVTIFGEKNTPPVPCTMPVPYTPPDSAENSDHLYTGEVPPVQHTGEINKTISNGTILNITKSTELSMADAEELMKERNTFLKLKKDCFEKLRKESSLEEDYIVLLDRALEHLWFKKKLEYEGTEYDESAVQGLLCRGLPPSLLAYSVDSLAHSSEPVRSPVAYLAKCIFALLLKGEEKLPFGVSAAGGEVTAALEKPSAIDKANGQGNASAYGKAGAQGNASAYGKAGGQGNAKQSSFGSLDVDDFFSSAFKSTYGDIDFSTDPTVKG